MSGRGLLVLFAVLVLAALARVSVGPVAEDGAIRLALAVPSGEILAVRLHSALGAALLGAVLGLSGLSLQTLLRNPLASPFVLGISSGAGFGVACVLAAGYLLAVPAASFGGELGGAVAGALATLALVAWLGRTRAGADPTTLVLSGVIVGSIFSAGTMLVEQLVPHGLRGDLLSWMAGRLPEFPSRAAFWTLVAAALCGWIALASRARALDVACLSEDEAESSGVALQPLRRVLFAVGGLLAAVSVAYAGPIGFVGLIGPHIARRLVGARHAMLVPGSALAGAAVLVSADLLRQLLDLGTGRLPVGVVTALAGGPAFLWLLRRRTGS